MIEFLSENDFAMSHENEVRTWIETIIAKAGYETGDISFVFCSDQYLLELNKQYLNHDTYTDIITFDYSLDKEVHAEIYISTDRVAENRERFSSSFEDELHRVIIHGILHCCGYGDKSETSKKAMRKAEDAALQLRSFL